MKQEDLERLGKDLERTYKELEATIQQVGRLKEIVQSLNIASDDIKELFASILSNDRLQSFKKQNGDIAKELREHIGQIESNINKILTQRNLFVDMIETYDQRFQKFESMVKTETETTEKMMKQITQMLSKLENDQKNLNARMDRFGKVVDSTAVIAKYDELIKEVKNNSKLLHRMKEEQNGPRHHQKGPHDAHNSATSGDKSKRR